MIAILESFFQFFHQFIDNMTINENFNHFHVTYNWRKRYITEIL